MVYVRNLYVDLDFIKVAYEALQLVMLNSLTSRITDAHKNLITFYICKSKKGKRLRRGICRLCL